ncbi:hypothetical protein AB1282_20080 [Gottfriedia sp. S16(2024)]|uniref:hypothetical protein n=1 Tax=Gottfriedia sp. S16(2024) TaxID=3162883 RepID=UPI003D254887
MKKMLAIGSISVLILGLSACTNDIDKQKKEQVSGTNVKPTKKVTGDNQLVISKARLGDGFSIEEWRVDLVEKEWLKTAIQLNSEHSGPLFLRSESDKSLLYVYLNHLDKEFHEIQFSTRNETITLSYKSEESKGFKSDSLFVIRSEDKNGTDRPIQVVENGEKVKDVNVGIID